MSPGCTYLPRIPRSWFRLPPDGVIASGDVAG
jgi:hypothetical protein